MLAENVLITSLKQFDAYPFLVKMNGKKYLIGKGEPEFAVTFHEEIPVSELRASTSLALGEAYMDGNLEIEGDLYGALDYFLGQMGKFQKNEKALRKRRSSSTGKRSQEREVQSHYDLGNDFFELWLDDTMSYSCGYFKKESDTLRQAQVNKVDYILEKLRLEEGMSLLDVGCGWGFLLIEAAKKYRVHGMGITLSREQYTEAKTRAVKEGLDGLVEFVLMDYRELRKCNRKFDRVVSVGMAEHVGREKYPLFLERINQAMKPGGLLLLHFISGLKEYSGDPWMKRYIFPGGMIPSLREMVYLAAENSLHVLDVENLRMHYNRTLLEWLKNYRRQANKVRELFDERFTRMWELYLASCAATFHNGVIDLHQILMSKGVNNTLPMVRWY